MKIFIECVISLAVGWWVCNWGIPCLMIIITHCWPNSRWSGKIKGNIVLNDEERKGVEERIKKKKMLRGKGIERELDDVIDI